MKKRLKRIRTVFLLDRSERKLFRQTLALLFHLCFRMAFSSFPDVIAFVKRKSPQIANEQISSPERLAWMVESIGIAFPRLLKCLSRALAGFILLRCCGWDVILKIGTRRRCPGLPVEAHAWLEWNGEIIIGQIAGMEKYAVFESLQGILI